MVVKSSLTAPLIKHLGIADYQQTFDAMRAHNRAMTPESGDEIWLLEHRSVFTQGLAGKPEHILDAGDIPVVKVDRGGQVTYHGPGQLVVYLLLNMRQRSYGVKSLVNRIEQSVIDLLAEYGIVALRQAGMPGVYVANGSPSLQPLSRRGREALTSLPSPESGNREHGAPDSLPSPLAGEGPRERGLHFAKIVAVGLRVANHATYHGLSLNIDMDLAPFSRINPCGYEGLATTQMSELGVQDKMDVISEKLLKHLKANLYG